jgi:hypothetical protein
MNDFTSIRGPVEVVDGKLVLLIPLEAGGEELIQCSQDIGVVDGDFLKVTISDSLAESLKIYEGSMVFVDNENGKFNITRAPVVPN